MVDDINLPNDGDEANISYPGIRFYFKSSSIGTKTIEDITVTSVEVISAF